MRTSILILLVISLSSAVAADPPPVEKLMTPEDFSAAGLDKLTEAERAHLSGWVARYRAGKTEGPPPPMTREERKEERKKDQEFEIVAKVIPAFRGWSGKTVFRLDNGQVWQQRQVGKLRYSGGDSTVTITKNLIGKYNLEHRDTGRVVGVKRIK